jgi:hypothetical protein
MKPTPPLEVDADKPAISSLLGGQKTHRRIKI